MREACVSSSHGEGVKILSTDLDGVTLLFFNYLYLFIYLFGESEWGTRAEREGERESQAGSEHMGS